MASAKAFDCRVYKRGTAIVQSAERLMKVGRVLVIPRCEGSSSLNKGTAARNAARERANKFLQDLKPQTVLDLIAENEKHQEIYDDDEP